LGQGTYWHALEACGLHPADTILDISSRRPADVTGGWARLKRFAGERRVTVGSVAGNGASEHAGFTELLAIARPRALSGSPARLAALARSVLDGDVRVTHPLAAVIYYGALMPEDHREVVARAFGAPIHSRYAAAEFVPPIACTCEHGWLHVDAHHLHVEIVAGGRHERAGRPAREGRVIVTDLTNFAAPLLRYEVGDVASWAPAAACACGRTWPRFAAVHGRHTDAARTPSGRRIQASTLFQLLYARMPEFADVVWEFQFRQHAPHEVELCVVPRPAFTQAHAAALEAALASATGGELRARVTAVDEIPLGPGDKRPLLVNLAVDAATAGRAP
jgi:phenylacetate-CoA ligase